MKRRISRNKQSTAFLSHKGTRPILKSANMVSSVTCTLPAIPIHWTGQVHSHKQLPCHRTEKEYPWNVRHMNFQRVDDHILTSSLACSLKESVACHSTLTKYRVRPYSESHANRIVRSLHLIMNADSLVWGSSGKKAGFIRTAAPKITGKFKPDVSRIATPTDFNKRQEVSSPHVS